MMITERKEKIASNGHSGFAQGGILFLAGSRTGGAETIQASVGDQETHLSAVYLWSKYVITQAQAGRTHAYWSVRRKKRKRGKARRHDGSYGVCFACKS